MCGCNSDCEVIRCPGCPGVDWSAYTWRWTAPASPGFLQPEGNPLKRFFYAQDKAMTYPGACRCLWIVDGNDQQQDTVGDLNPVDVIYPVASIGALQYRRFGTRAKWQLTLSRWYYAWAWTVDDPRYYGGGWGWSPTWAGDDCSGVYGNPYWGGYGGYGYNGWGWGYGGYAGYGLYYGEYGSTYTVTYSLPDDVTMDCSTGTTRFFLDPQPDNEFFDADSWPEYVDITRVRK